MAVITPNFNFSGQCAEAIELYRKAFDAEIGCMMRYGDAHAQDMNDAWKSTDKSWIYHAELIFGGQRIMLTWNSSQACRCLWLSRWIPKQMFCAHLRSCAKAEV